MTFVAGKVAEIETDAEMQSDAILLSAASLLRRYHDCTERVASGWAGRPWQLPPRAPFETICHGDFAPYNTVLGDSRVVGIIDFEAAHPGPRAWDLAYALYRWAPFTTKAAELLTDIDVQIARARRFLDAYGVDRDDRIGLADLVVERLESLIAFMAELAANGADKYAVNINAGHDLIYRADIGYIIGHRARIIAGLAVG